jgi:carbamate kinase
MEQRGKKIAPRRVIVSIGGNVIIGRDDTGAIEEQIKNAEAACGYISRLACAGTSVIITHGNGPVVGNIILQNEAARDITPPMPLYICDADSEGGLGFLIQQSLHNRLKRSGCPKDVVAVVTQVVVEASDPAFTHPTKPVGPFYTLKEAERLKKTRGWAMAEDSNRGYRRVVPSPKPKRIVEAGVVKKLSEAAGVIVIAAGGGGVPVLEGSDGTLTGVDAVVDKDLATSLLAIEAGSELFINLTQIDKVYLNFGRPDQSGLDELSVKDAKKYLTDGHFAPGSMGPKIEAAIEFLEAGGEEVIITTPELLKEALAGRAGTRIYE